MAKKNIAFLLTKVAERGGISRVASIITKELSAYNVHIIGYQKKDEKGYDWGTNLTFHNLREDAPSMKKGIFAATFSLRKLLKENNISVMVACGNLVGPLGVFATWFSKCRLIFWSHSSFKGSTQKKKYRKIYEQFITLFSELTISLTKTDAENYRKHTFAKKVVHLYNPIDETLLQKKHVYNQDSKNIISVGRLTYSKRFDMLIELVKPILEQNSEWQLHIYGSGEQEEHLKNQIQELNLQDKVILKGQSNQLYELYGQYAMMVMTSEYEGFPMTLIEGMASALPLVSFDIPTGPNEIIREGENGYLIPAFDTQMMTEKIGDLVLNADTRTKMASAHAQYIEEFRLATIIAKWNEIL